MANPQTENGFTRLSNELWDEIMKRKFTDRQQKIIKMIIRLSYGCQEKEAVIPMLKDFELCGVQNTKIKDELTHLVESKVIFWNPHTNVFSVNKNHDEWKKDLVRGWDSERFKELIHINLAKKETKERFPKNEVGSQKGNSLPEEKGTTEFPKGEVEEGKSPSGSKDEEPLKESIKENLKEKDLLLQQQEELEHLVRVYEENGFKPIKDNRVIPPLIKSDIVTWLKKGSFDEPADIIETALHESLYKGKSEWGFTNFLLEDWEKKNLRTVEAVQQDYEEHRKSREQKVVPIKKGDRDGKPKGPSPQSKYANAHREW